MLFVGGKIVYYNNKFIRPGNYLPPDPDLHEGYWVHKDSGVITEFDNTDSSITGTTFNTPTWKNDAKEIKLPEGVTAIANNALADSSNLVKLTIPSSVTSIGNNVLSNTPNFRHLHSYPLIAPTLTSLGANVGDFNLQIKVEASSFDSYRLAPGWSQYYLKLFVLNDLIPGSRVHSGYTNLEGERILGTQLSDIIIENTVFDGNLIGDFIGITLYNSHNIIIRNCKFINFRTKRAINLEGCSNVAIYNCDFIEVQSGMRIADSPGGIRVFSNDIKNILGETYTSQEGFGQAIQIMTCSGANNRVQDNAIENILYESRVEDIITVYNSHLGDADPFIVRNNWIRGGGGAGDGDGAAGGGINIGDGTGTNVTTEDNICVRTGGFGIGIAGGDRMTLQRNIVYNPQTIYSELGMGVANWYPEQTPETLTVRENRVWGIKRDGTVNHWWYWDNNFPVIGKETNVIDSTLSESVLPVQIIGVESGSNISEKGYWIDRNTGVKSTITLLDSFVIPDTNPLAPPGSLTMTRPSWISNASEVSLPEGIYSISTNAFSNSNISTLITPSTLSVFYNNSINNCLLLNKLYIYYIGSSFSFGSGSFGDYSLQIKVQSDRYDYYNSIFTPLGLGKKLFILNNLIPGSRVHSGYEYTNEARVYYLQDNIVIEGIHFDDTRDENGDPAYSIYVTMCDNVIIRNCRFTNTSAYRAVMIENATNATVYNCDFEDVKHGIIFQSCTESCRVFSCDIKNIQGERIGDPDREGGGIQFTYCTGADIRCQDNAIEHIEGESSVIDLINVFNCFFPEDNPYICRNNWARGGGPKGHSGGFLIGDYGGLNGIIEDNVLVNPGQYGIQISGGLNHTMRNNLVYGEALPWSNVGVVVADWTPDIPPNGNLTVENNRVRWYSANGADGPFWVWDAQLWPHGWSTNTWQDPTVGYDMLPAQIIGV